MGLLAVGSTDAFSINKPFKPTTKSAPSNIALHSSADPQFNLAQPDNKMFPLKIPMTRIEGGGTLRTYKMPPGTERIEMEFQTNGRPMKALIELWTGPIRRTHRMEIINQDGSLSPYRAVLKCKKFDTGGQVLKVSAHGGYEYPLEAGVAAASPERAKQLEEMTMKVWDNNPKQFFQGGPIEGGPGMVKTFPIDANVKSVQIIFWSARVGKKSCKAGIELLHGPNNTRQSYDLQCSGSGQPLHAVFETPGAGWVVRIYNKNFLEFPFEAMVVPYEVGEDRPDDPYAPISFSTHNQL